MRPSRIILPLLQTLGCCCVAAAAAAAQVSRTIGIDIDEAHVRVGVLQNGKVEVLRNDQGVELTPSYVAFTSSGRRLIGDEAKIQLTTNPQNTLFSVFLLMGRRFDDVIVQNHIRRMPYRVYSRNGKPVIEVQVGDRDETFAPEEIVAMLLRKMKEIAELYVNETVTAAVVSTPSCFSYLEIQAMRAAGTMAGLNETFIVSASVAAGVASAKAGEGAGERTQLLLGVGHSCAEAAVISITDHPAAIQVEAQASLRDVGVEQLQRRVMEHVLEQIEQKAGQSVAEKWKQSLASQKLCREVEMGIRSLATKDTAHIQTESLSDGLNCSEILTQSRFDALSADLAAKILYLAINTAKSADKQAGDIHGIILLGSASRASAIRRVVGTAFNRMEIMDDGFLDPDKASVIGAAIYAGHLDGTTSASAGLAVLTVNARTFGYMTATDEFVPMLHPNDIVPNKNDGPAGVDSSGQEVTHIVLLVYEAAGDGAQNQEYIGNLTMDLPPTLSTDVWITFQMEKFHKLQVTLDEMKTGASKNITFEHDISAWQLQKARRRLKGLAKADRQELSRQQARDGLESLAYGCLRRVKRPVSSETSTVPRETETEDRALAEAEALGAINWLEANREAEVAELVTKTRELELALAKISSPC